MCECVIIITYNNVSVNKVSFITVWCDVVYVFMCTQEKERERYRVCCVYCEPCMCVQYIQITSVKSFVHGDIPIKTQMLHIMDVILKVSCNTEKLGGCTSWVNRQ